MWQMLEPLFVWGDRSWVGVRLRASTWAFAYIEVFHLLGLTVLLGCIIVLSLRLAGLALRSRPASEVFLELRPYLLSALALSVFSGGLMVTAEAEKCFESVAYRNKMILLGLALLFQFTLVRPLIRANEGRFPATWGKIAAAISLILWFGVAWMGRAIAFF
jgi:hypothetical protein